MRVLFVIDSLSGGGAERVATHIINNLDRDRFEVSLCLTLSNTRVYPVAEDVRVYVLPGAYSPKFLRAASARLAAFLFALIQCVLGKGFSRPYHHARTVLDEFLSSVGGLRRVVAEERPDVVISFLRNSNVIVLLARALARLRVPVCCSDRINLSEDLRTVSYPGANRVLLRLLYGHMLSGRGDRYLAVTRDAGEDIAAHFGVSLEKIITVYNGIDTAQVVDRSNEPLGDDLERAFSSDGLKVIAMGRLAKQKGHVYLLRAFHLVQQEFPCRLYILGEGEEKENLESLAQGLGVSDSVHFLGWHANPFAILRRCDFFVLSSLWEGFPNVILEAMALGLPVVATDCPSGPAEVLDGGEYGILVPPGDEVALSNALRAMMADKDLCSRFSQKSRERASHFSLTKMLHNVEALAENMIKQ